MPPMARTYGPMSVLLIRTILPVESRDLAYDHAMQVAGDLAPQMGEPRAEVADRRPRWLVYLIACVVLLVCAAGGLWLWEELRHPTAFSDFGYGAGATVAPGTTVTFPLTPDPWHGDHGTLHVHAITPASVEDIPPGATLSVWRCSRTDVGAPGGPTIGEGPINRVCAGAERVSGHFDYDASHGSREALLLAVTSPTPGVAGFGGVVIDYREGLHSGRQVINVDGEVHFRHN